MWTPLFRGPDWMPITPKGGPFCTPIHRLGSAQNLVHQDRKRQRCVTEFERSRPPQDEVMLAELQTDDAAEARRFASIALRILAGVWDQSPDPETQAYARRI
jgi:hypothetical protein